MRKKKKIDKYIFVISGLLIVLLVLTFLIIRKNGNIKVIKDKYDYVDKLKLDVDYLNQEYDKLLLVYNDNEEFEKSNMELKNEIDKLEKDIRNLEEKIVKMENTK